MSEPLKGGFSSFTTGTPFKPPGSAATQPSTGLFGSATAGANGGSTTQNTSTTSAFGTSGSTGASLFGNLQAKPAGGSLFGGGTTTSSSGPATTTGAGTNLFSGFGTTSTTPSTAQNVTSAPASSSTPSFGGNLFGSKPPEQPASSSAPASSTTPQPSGSLFGAPSGSTSGSTSGQPASAAASTTTNLFGRPVAPSTSTPSPAPGAPSGGNLFGNNLFGKKPDTPTTSSTSPAPATSTAPSLFSGFSAKKDDSTDKDKQKDGTATPANVAGTPLGQPPANKDAPSGTSGTAFNLFGQKPAEKKDAPTEGEKKDDTAAPPSAPIGTTTSGTGTPAPALSVPPPSTLRGKTLEEIVNKWTSELDQHVGDFKKIAGEIAVWDRALIDNGNTIAALLQHVTLAEREQSDIEQSLKHMEDQQKELASTLEQYEKSSGEIFDSQSGGLRSLDVGPADAERDKHYTLAAELNASLDDLSRSLLQMIESVNTLSEDGGSDSDGGRTRGDAPLEQIAQILSSHLESLQWIDGAVKEVETKVTDVERLVNDASVNSSRTAGGTASLSGSINGSRNSGMRGSRGFSLR